MKLIAREPPPEMLAIISNEPEVFGSAEDLWAALYDAAPEIQQEPVAIVDANDDGYWADILPDRSVKVGQLLFAFPPDAQAEIAKLDASILEYQQDLQIRDDHIAEQTAEISRLKGVIAQCEKALEPISYVEPSWVVSKAQKALAAIKEEIL